MTKFKVVIGDWSDDGHGKCNEYMFEANKTLAELQEGYRQSCRTTGVQFHHSNFTDDYSNGIQICTEYEESSIPRKVVDILIDYNVIDLTEWDESVREEIHNEFYFDGSDHFAECIMKFIKISIPDLEYKMIKDDVPALNGWWGELNHQFGYGLYH